MFNKFLKNEDNNIKKFKKHIQYNGYKITEEYEDGSYIAYNDTYGPIFVGSIGDEGSIGVRLTKLYPVNISNCKNDNDVLELHNLVNDMNKKLGISTCLLSDENYGLTQTYSMIGYDKKNASKVLEGFHFDCEKIFDFDLERFWTTEAAA